MFPGSMGPCREIYQEGVRIPPVKLVAGGVLNQALLQLILNNVRTPEEREGDLTAQIGACRIGVTRVTELVSKYGLERVQANVYDLLNHSERLMSAALEGLPEGVFEAEDYLDNDGITNEPVRLAVEITTDPARGRIAIDFTGSAPQVAGSLNAVSAITYSAVFYVLRCLLSDEAATTAGLMRPVSLCIPAGSVVNALHPLLSRRGT